MKTITWNTSVEVSLLRKYCHNTQFCQLLLLGANVVKNICTWVTTILAQELPVHQDSTLVWLYLRELKNESLQKTPQDMDTCII